MTIKNTKWVLRNRPEGLVKDSDFELSHRNNARDSRR